MRKQHQHFGIYALALDNQAKNILLIKKSRGAYTGMYDLPGGSPEGNEVLKETLFREVLEETGAEIQDAKDLGSFKVLFEYQKDGQPCLLTHKCHIFLTTLSSEVSENLVSSDSDGCVWLDIDDVRPPVIKALEIYQSSEV